LPDSWVAVAGFLHISPPISLLPTKPRPPAVSFGRVLLLPPRSSLFLDKPESQLLPHYLAFRIDWQQLVHSGTSYCVLTTDCRFVYSATHYFCCLVNTDDRCILLDSSCQQIFLQEAEVGSSSPCSSRLVQPCSQFVGSWSSVIPLAVFHQAGEY
jgi:hypothetical protein